MEERILKFIENQLRVSGFAEAFNAELKAQIEEKIPLIQHAIQKEFNGDQIEATLFLKKSAISDYYVLKRFDLRLQKEGRVDSLSQSFKISDTSFGSNQLTNAHRRDETRYTLKEAYNLLAGRAIYKNLRQSDGSNVHAWVRLNMKVCSAETGVQDRAFEIKYGFDLEKALKNYSIKELASERLKQSLIQSLQRGNVKKVTFIGPRKTEEQLYISPNIGLSCLNVRDKNKLRLSTGELSERKYIGKDFIATHNQQLQNQTQKKATQLEVNDCSQQLAVGNKDNHHNPTSQNLPKNKLKR